MSEEIPNPDRDNLPNSRFGFVSTSTTTINSTLYKNSFVFEKNAYGYVFSNSLYNYMKSEKFAKDEPGVTDLISDQPKVLIDLTTSYYHLYHDHIGEFLTQYEITPDAKFLINITHIANRENLPGYIKMFFKFLNDKKIDYKPIDLSKFNKFNINNLYYRNTKIESLEINNPSVRVRNHFTEYVKDKSCVPTRKVFLSRKNFQGRDLEILIKGRLPYQNDNRIDDEGLLQEYFKSLGFEVVVPEDFKSFEDQINYFYETKMLISTTSSGFTNAMFMQPGSTMVELTTPLISFSFIGNGITQPLSQGQEEIHHFYHMMSLALGHNFISIPNKDRSAKKIIDIIEGNTLIKNILTEGVN